MKLTIILFLLINHSYADAINSFDKSQEYERHENIQKREFNKVELNINKLWKEVVTSSGKVFVSYYNNQNSRLMVDYEKGFVKIETLGKSKTELRNILTEIIDDESRTDSVLSIDELTLSKSTKADLINSLMEKVRIDESDLGNIKTKLSFNMLSEQLQIRANKYFKIIKKWASINKIDPELIMAITRHESAFNPRAQSPIPAYGLMQIVPKYAGRDVMITIGGVDYTPTQSELFDPETNVSFGTSYIYLLKNKFSYFTKDSKDLQSLVIAGYNWGPQRILDAIKTKRIDFKKPNVHEQIMKIAPLETKNYLKAVTETTRVFKQEV